jgi:hypothetical protein
MYIDYGSIMVILNINGTQCEIKNDILSLCTMSRPNCQSTQIIKYGHTDYGSPHFCYQNHLRQFAEDPM